MKCLVWTVSLYGSETWTLRKREREDDMLNALEIMAVEEIGKNHMGDERPNESVLQEIGVERELLRDTEI